MRYLTVRYGGSARRTASACIFMAFALGPDHAFFVLIRGFTQALHVPNIALHVPNTALVLGVPQAQTFALLIQCSWRSLHVRE